MKREGRQHGTVRCYPILPSPWNPKPETRYFNRVNFPPTGGLFTKVSPKPTNHSKYTGKCGTRCVGCHIQACKSKDKSKGTQKLRSCDSKPGLKFVGFSASRILDHLANDYLDDDEVVDDIDEESCDYSHRGLMADSEIEIETAFGNAKIMEDGDDDDDKMSFCDVGFVWEQVDGDEGWCLVGEM